MSTSTHYSLGLEPNKLAEWATKAAERLRGKLRDPKSGRYAQPILCFRGFSGIAHATALALAYRSRYGGAFGMIYVRKSREQSHGKCREWNLAPLDDVKGKVWRLVFVDDFQETGATFQITVKAALRVLKGYAPYRAKLFDTDDSKVILILKTLSRERENR